MGSIWLHDLPQALAGLPNVDFYPGWETRARGSGGYTALQGIACHHTASSASPANDMSYMWDSTSGDQPIGAIYLARDGRITVGCAGATNTVGKGGPMETSKGTIPLDDGNARSISIEAANAGTGEPWGDAQQDSYLALVDALCDWYGFVSWLDVFSHFEWTPGRKIDPAGPSRFGTINSSQTWNMDMFRDDLTTPAPTPTPEPDDEEYDMPFLIRNNADGGVALVYGSGKVTGIDGTALPQMIDKFGNWIDVEPVTYQDFINKSS